MIAQDNLLTIEGRPRSRLNSKGDLLHATEEGIVNFWKWFGDSKCIDEVGRPLVVYHGTKAVIDVFKTPAWFTDNEKFADMFSADWGDGTRTTDSKVIPVYLRITTPFNTDDWDVTEYLGRTPAWVKSRKREGFDGVFFRSPDDAHEIEWVVFDANQIKSVTHNSGEFNPESVLYCDGGCVPYAKDDPEEHPIPSP